MLLRSIILASLIFRLILSIAIYSGDLNNHVGWGESILISGFKGAYDRQYVGIMQPTYPPFSLFSFTTSVGVYKLINTTALELNHSIPAFPSKIIWSLEDQDVLPAFTKIIAIACDIGIGLLIYRFARILSPKSSKLNYLILVAYLFNPAVWYISSLWGQVESTAIFFVLLSMWLVQKNKPNLSVLSLMSALLFKQSAIIFVPVVALVFFKKFSLKTIFNSCVAATTLFFLSYLPFLEKKDILWPLKVYINRIQTGSGSIWITDHAFNPWIWYSRGEKIPDFIPVLGNLSPSIIGLSIFLIISAIILYLYFKNKFSWQNTFLLTSSISALAFLVLTKMHERYFAPVLPFLLLSSIKFPKLRLIYLIASMAHLANLYHDWYYPRIVGLDTFIASWNSILMISVLFTISGVLILFTYIKSILKKYE